MTTKISHQHEDLPQELIFEILSKLPVKSLLKFRCVSKSWLSLISSRQFIEAHLNTSSNNGDYTHHRLISSAYFRESYYLQFDLRQFCLRSILSTTSFEIVDGIDYPMKSCCTTLSLLGSCNGLLFINIHDRNLFMWNPSIRKSKKLPGFDDLTPYRYASYGFGYDKLNDDYKVVGILGAAFEARFDEIMVILYSRKTDSWRSIEGYKDGRPLYRSGTFLDGRLFWTARHSGFDGVNKIVSFDLSNETFGEVKLPESCSSSYSWAMGVLGGCLSLTYMNQNNTHVDIWIMVEYSVGQSWTKLCSMPSLDNPLFKAFLHHTPVFLLKNGEIVLKYGSIFVLYNPKHNLIRYKESTNKTLYTGLDLYVESLVSPDAIGP